MVSRFLFPAAFVVGMVGLVFTSVPLIAGAMVVAVLAGFGKFGE